MRTGSDWVSEVGSIGGNIRPFVVKVGGQGVFDENNLSLKSDRQQVELVDNEGSNHCACKSDVYKPEQIFTEIKKHDVL